MASRPHIWVLLLVSARSTAHHVCSTFNGLLSTNFLVHWVGPHEDRPFYHTNKESVNKHAHTVYIDNEFCNRQDGTQHPPAPSLSKCAHHHHTVCVGLDGDLVAALVDVAEAGARLAALRGTFWPKPPNRNRQKTKKKAKQNKQNKPV